MHLACFIWHNTKPKTIPTILLYNISLHRSSFSVGELTVQKLKNCKRLLLFLSFLRLTSVGLLGKPQQES
jgi:hypothetical protein